MMVRRAGVEDAQAIALMVVELLEEIMAASGSGQFSIDREKIRGRCRGFLERGIYTVFIAPADAGQFPMGFIALTEVHALYAEGAFGVIPEFYVRPGFRSLGMGRALMDAAMAYARERGWQRLEVTTPPLPQFERTYLFYAGQGFEVAGGRKMKVSP